jgi:hypothetical protein
MQPIFDDRRREPRFSIQAGAVVGLRRDGQVVNAITINMSGCGVLLQFPAPVDLTVGDTVVCDFHLPDETGRLLPCWAEGIVIRLDGNRVAIDFRSAGWADPSPEQR